MGGSAPVRSIPEGGQDRDVLERFAQLGLDREVVIPADNR